MPRPHACRQRVAGALVSALYLDSQTKRVNDLDVIRPQDGNRSSFVLFAKEIGNVLGINFSNALTEKDRIALFDKSLII